MPWTTTPLAGTRRPGEKESFVKGFHGKSAAVVLAAAAALGAPSISAYGAAEPTQSELLRQIEALRAKVDALEAGQSATTQRLDSREVDAAVDRVLSDADARSRFLQQQGFTAGYNKGKFTIQSEDGKFTLVPQAQLQVRYVANYREEASQTAGTPPVTDEDPDNVESGLEIRRLRLSLSGNVYGPKLTYFFQWQTDRNGGAVGLQDAWAKYQINDSWAVRAGQFQDFWTHEETTSSKRQLTVDRSLLNEYLGGGDTDRVQGATVIWDDGAKGSPFRAEVGYIDGANSDNTNFVDGGGSATFDVANPDFGFTGRAEYLAFGDWKQYEDFTALGNDKDLLIFGAGASFTEAGNANALYHTVDAQYETGRWGLYGALVGVASDNDNATGGNFYDWGALAQAGYLLTDKWEIFGRYDYVDGDDDRTTGDGEYQEITAGVNYYLEKHSAKFTVDLTYLPDGTPLSGGTANGIGHLDNENDEAEIVFRAQFQLLL
jgi:hypothetical protein